MLTVTDLIAPFAASGISCLLILATIKWHGVFTLDHLEGVQRLHENATPRIGGLAIMFSLGIGVLILDGESRILLRNMFVLSFIVFSFGFTEDLSKRVSVALRLWAGFMPAILGYFLTGVTLSHVGWAPVDYVLGFKPVAIVFTAFAMGGVIQATNIIDGLNGLCAWVTIWAIGSIMLIALQVGDMPMALMSVVILTSIIGFLVFNWPFGKLFLGDGGSYLLGLCVAWGSVLLAMRNPSVSPFALLLAYIYPITEVLYSIYRRRSVKQAPGQPDRLHFHQLVATVFIYQRFIHFSSIKKNSLSGFLVSLAMAVPSIVAVRFYDQTPILLFATGFGVLTYITSYQWIFNKAKLLAEDIDSADPINSALKKI